MQNRDKQRVLAEIKKLVARFEQNISQYKRSTYDEANTRVDFIDPFFEALGWDVANKNGYAEQYREVVREDKVIIVGKHKAPDYSFRIGGIRKFFVEAKKPSVDIKKEISPAYQLRRYAYTAKLPLSILTDFEEFSVYDTRIKPHPKDNPSTARIFYCKYKDYLKDLDFIYNTFSKEAILKGSFDRYVAENKNKKGTSEVDKEFLKLIDKWREKLAKNIALRNKDLSLFELNYTIQKIIDRIIFLRIAEDRQIEDYGKLQILQNGGNVYRRLMEIFKRADVKYNSGLFNFERDIITPKITVDDKVIKEIIKSVYYPESPYEFSVLDVEILGNIYEQFLGKTIRLTPAHQVKIEEKPEVKKAGGVYYTPKYIVDYIVKNTVGEIIKGKTPKQIEKIKILDPACGSGSFLLGAYQYLLNYHLNWYSKPENRRKALKKGEIIQKGKDNYQLTIAEKQKILTNNIFGVDIDSQAVEVSKLSLLLKLLEGETEQSAGKLFKYTQMKLLPDLSNNIKCGNSLIGTDYFANKVPGLIDEEEIRRINPFDWEKEFPDIFKQGGFDAVIGNPPWVESKFMDAKYKVYYKIKYFSMKKQFDIFNGFIEQSLQALKKYGILSFITPNRFVMNIDYQLLREYILNNAAIVEFTDVGEHIFENVEMPAIIFILKKEPDLQKRKRKRIKIKVEIRDLQKKKWEEYTIKQSRFYNESYKLFTIYQSDGMNNIVKKMDMCSNRLSEYVINARGVEIGKKSEIVSLKKLGNDYIHFLVGEDIDRYIIRSHRYLKLGVKGIDYKSADLYSGEKILIRKTGTGIRATYDNSGYYVIQVIYIFKPKTEKPKIKYILGLLNSKLMSFYYFAKFGEKSKKTFPHLRQTAVLQLPIRTIDFSNPKEKKMHDDLVAMVEQMLALQKKYHSARLEQDKKLYKTQIDILDKKIDSLVYQLYGLTEEEIKVVEGG